jgi:hypothetical protein
LKNCRKIESLCVCVCVRFLNYVGADWDNVCVELDAVIGFFMRFEDDSVESAKNVKQWNVKIISVSIVSLELVCSFDLVYVKLWIVIWD